MLARRKPRSLWALGPLGELQNEMDRLMGDWFDADRPGLFSYDVDIKEDDNHLYIEADLPGMSKEQIQITLENGILTISGTKKSEKEEKNGNYHMRERRQGQFSRSFQLPTLVDENNVDAVLKEGVLKVKLNKREEVKPKRIEVKVS